MYVLYWNDYLIFIFSKVFKHVACKHQEFGYLSFYFKFFSIATYELHALKIYQRKDINKSFHCFELLNNAGSLIVSFLRLSCSRLWKYRCSTNYKLRRWLYKKDDKFGRKIRSVEVEHINPWNSKSSRVPLKYIFHLLLSLFQYFNPFFTFSFKFLQIPLYSMSLSRFLLNHP